MSGVLGRSRVLGRSLSDKADKIIPDEILTRILDTALLAPSANNRQEWRFVVVRDDRVKAELARLAGDQRFVAEAPAALVCCGVADTKIIHCGQRAFPIDVAIDHITLLATAAGLGTCWIGHFDEPGVKALLHIPSPVRVVELLPVGYPTDPSPKQKNRLPLDEVVMYGEWRS